MYRWLRGCSMIIIAIRLSGCIWLARPRTVITCSLLLLLVSIGGWSSDDRRRWICGDNWHWPSQLGLWGRGGYDRRNALCRGWTLQSLQSRRRSRCWSTMRGWWSWRHSHYIWCSGCRWNDGRITWSVFSTTFDSTCWTLLESKCGSLDQNLVPIKDIIVDEKQMNKQVLRTSFGWYPILVSLRPN